MNLFNCLGVGTVASDKASNTDMIFVHIKAHYPLADGEVVLATKQNEQSIKDKNNEIKSSTVMTANAKPAKWLPYGNRLTSPDVRKGSQVAIYQMGDSNTLYWTTWGVNAETFRLETVLWGFSANPNLNQNTPFNSDNFYIFTVSTVTGEVSFKSSKANKEPLRLTFKIDTKRGNFIYADENKNSLGVIGKDKRLFMTNMNNTSFIIDNENLSVNAPKGQIDVNANKNITFTAGQSIIIKANENVNLSSGKETSIVSGSTTSLSSADTTMVKASQLIIDAPIEAKQGLTVEGESNLKGGTNMTGATTIDGKEIKDHDHANGNDGQDTGKMKW